MTDQYVFVPTAPSADEYMRLRSVSGLSPKSAEQAAPALANSWRFCHVRAASTNAAVAMGRVLGDGGWYFHLADMATDPAHQRRGLGRRIIEWLIAEIDGHAPPHPYITLMADEPGRPLYLSIGFVETAPRSLGMRLPR